jgi:biopolymer transport protein ExbD
MGRIRKKKSGGTPAMSTASLPDIVFMLLFFFMVTTTMREVDLKVNVSKPKATEIQKLERKDLVAYIYVGTPKNTATYGSEPRVQLDDQLATTEDIGSFVVVKREEINEKERPLMTVSIKSDIKVRMGLIGDIKQELRKAQALKINYSTNPTTKEDLFKVY